MMKIKLLILILLMGCSVITTKGLMVEVRKKVSIDDLQTHENIGEVACRNNIYLVTTSYNRQLCTDYLRNHASNLGADFIVVNKNEELDGFISTGVEMRADAYKRKSKK